MLHRFAIRPHACGLIFFLFVLTGCAAPAPASSSAAPTDAPAEASETARPLSSPHPLDTAVPNTPPSGGNPTATWTTATPTFTPTLPAPLRAPWLAFLYPAKTGTVLTLVGSDGLATREIGLPESARVGECFECMISPDGKWLAYWKGSAGDPDDPFPPDPNGTYDLELGLLNISDGTSETLAKLLSPDYPDIFQKNAEAVKDLPENSVFEPDDLADRMHSAFLKGIESAVWSPDGRYLAFAGEMDGPSSDLYVYDTAVRAIRRLSSGRTNITSTGSPAITWSPDGKWIVAFSSYADSSAVFLMVRPNGSGYKEIKGSGDNLAGWLSNSTFLSQDGSMEYTGYLSHLRTANLETGGVTTIWKCQFDFFAADPAGRFLINQSMREPEFNCPDTGLFFRNPSAGRTLLISPPEEMYSNPEIQFLGQGDRRFLYHDISSGTYVVTSKGEKKPIMDDGYSPFLSPDRKWIIFTGKDFRRMDGSGNISDPIADIRGYNTGVDWRPDSQGYLFSHNGDLYYASPVDSAPAVLEGIQFPIGATNRVWRPDSQGYCFNDGSFLYLLNLADRSLTKVFKIPDLHLFNPVWVAAPK